MLLVRLLLLVTAMDELVKRMGGVRCRTARRRRWLRPLLVALVVVATRGLGVAGCDARASSDPTPESSPDEPLERTAHESPRALHELGAGSSILSLPILRDDDDGGHDTRVHAKRAAGAVVGGATLASRSQALARAHLWARSEATPSPFEGISLEPYLRGPQAEAARALYDARRYVEGRAAFDALAVALEGAGDSPDGVRAARFMAALCAFYADDWRDAIARFEALLETYPTLADTHRTFAAIAHYQLREYEAAVALASAVDPRAGNAVRATHFASRALMRLDRPAEARERLLDLDRRLGAEPTTLLLLSQAWQAESARDEELDVLRRLQAGFPDSWEAKVARKRLSALEPDAAADEGAKRPQAEEASAAAAGPRAALNDLREGRRLYERFRNERAVVVLGRAVSRLQPGSAPWCEAIYYLSRALERTRDYRAASARYEEAVASCPDSSLRSEMLYYGARSHFRNNNPDRALPLIGALRAAPSDAGALLDDALLLEAHVHEARLDVSARRQVLEHILVERDDPQARHEAAFQLVWQDFRAANYAHAVATAERALAELPREDRHYSRGRLAYWRARSLERQGALDAALAGYREVLSSFPMSWYAHLSLARLAEHGGAEAAREAFAASLRAGWPQPAVGQGLGALLDAPAFVAAVEFARLGLTVSVRRELEALSDAAEPDELWLYVEVLQALGETTEAVELARRQLASFQDHAPAGAHARRWALAYPRPYAELTAASAAASGVDEALVLAIMREETSFNPRAESPANALGIMQLMQPTARSLVRAGEPVVVSPQSLREPALNIELGTRYLARLGAKFGAHPALVAAAYNAGGPRVRSWLSQAPEQQPLDEFVESIPYVETRRYVMRVVSTAGVYTYLRDGEPLRISLGLSGVSDADVMPAVAEEEPQTVLE